MWKDELWPAEQERAGGAGSEAITGKNVSAKAGRKKEVEKRV